MWFSHQFCGVIVVVVGYFSQLILSVAHFFYVVVENRSNFNIFSGSHVWSGNNADQLGGEQNKGNVERQLNATDLKRFDESGWPDVDLRKSYFPAERVVQSEYMWNFFWDRNIYNCGASYSWAPTGSDM